MSAQDPPNQDGLNQPDSDNEEWYWSDRQAGNDIKLHDDKHTVTFHPNRSSFCTVIRGTKVLNRNMEHYFEVEMRSPFYGQARQVGIGTKHTTMQSNLHDFYPLLGKDHNSWAINYNGLKHHSGSTEKHISIDPDKYDVIHVAVHYDSYYGALSFELNGKSSGLAFDRVITNLELYPMMCSSAAQTTMKLTHCSSTVMSLKALSRGVIRMNISKDQDYDSLGLPSHMKAYVMYKSPKSSKTARKEHKDVTKATTSKISTI